MKVLVLGATGYLGARVMRRLPEAEALARVDLSDPTQARRALSPWRWDAVVNAAGPAPKGSQGWAEARRTIEEHVRIALNLAALVPAESRIVHVSGVIVYGIPERRPITEDHARAPIHAYGLAKSLAEDALATHRDTWLLRMGGLFSEDRTGGALYNFLSSAKQKKPLRVTAQETLPWDILHVDDAARAVALALERPGEGAVNVSTGEPIDLVGVARRIATRYGGVVEDVAGVAHPTVECDTSKMRRAFGWTPVGLDVRLDQWWSAL
jgi:nucleoside-diphosphate-sugar epimerase